MGERRSKSRAQLRDQMVKGLGAFKVRRPRLILQACIKHCNPPRAPVLAGIRDKAFWSHDPAVGPPKTCRQADAGQL